MAGSCNGQKTKLGDSSEREVIELGLTGKNRKEKSIKNDSEIE